MSMSVSGVTHVTLWFEYLQQRNQETQGPKIYVTCLNWIFKPYLLSLLGLTCVQPGEVKLVYHEVHRQHLEDLGVNEI